MQTSVLTGCKIPGSGYDSVSIEGKLVTIVTRLAAHKELQFRRAMVLQNISARGGGRAKVRSRPGNSVRQSTSL